MYEAYFKLQDRPFLSAPLPTRYFPAASIEQARQSISRCIDRGEGAACIIGPPGTGKSLLCQLLAEEFSERFAVAQLSGRLSTRHSLFQSILYELGLPYRNLDEGELRLALLDYLDPKSQDREGLLLIVDEAHTLPWRLLEEVRLITNLVRGGQPRVRVVLAGGSLLEERLASPKLSSLAQRLSARCYLEPLNSPETAEYVKSQITAVGGDAQQLFDAAALRSVFRATDGIPRLINQVCDHALILASLGGLRRLTSEAVDEAWADLQQLPSPWQNASDPPAENSIVEFGGLDEPQDELSAIPFRLPAASVRETSAESLELFSPPAAQPAKSEPVFLSGESEIELEFPEFGDPFQEKFAEEEIVLERFRNAAEIFAHAPRVSSLEGKKIGPLLTPWVALPPLDLAACNETRTSPAPVVQPQTPLSVPGPLVAVGQGNVSLISASSRQVLAGVECESSTAGAVVVDDAPPVSKPIAKSPHRGEFKGLFAKLRRG